MARIENGVRITPSVLDRLLDYDPQSTREAPKSRSASLTDLRQAVRRDLEWLLNTRCFVDADDEGLTEAKRSVAYFGMPDFTGLSVQDAQAKDDLVRAIETAIKNFEPRFLGVKVTLEPVDGLDRQLRFRIEARLDVDPVPEQIVFDSVMQAGTGGFSVTEK
jgi:type VI secretion system protein ImpF